MRWTEIKKNQEWRNKRTGRHCLVEKAPESQMGFVHVIHSTGRQTMVLPETLLKQYTLRVITSGEPSAFTDEEIDNGVLGGNPDNEWRYPLSWGNRYFSRSRG